jgi:hypothetical protein
MSERELEFIDINVAVDEDEAGQPAACCAELQRRLESEMKRCDELARQCKVNNVIKEQSI